MKKFLNDYSIQFVKEIIPVIAGILIALFIDNWNSERKDKAYLNQIFTTINSELKDSNEDIKTTIYKQKNLIDSLEFYSNNSKVTIQDVVIKSKGFYLPQIKTNAWKAVSNSKIDLIAYNKIAAFSYIDEQKQNLLSKNEFLMEYLYSNINETDRNKKQTLKMIILDIIQTENSISKQIEAIEIK